MRALKWGRPILKGWGILFAILVGMIGFSSTTYAVDPPENFSLQVTPSPLFTVLKPGTQTTLELKIRNASTGTEELRIDPRSFKVDNDTGEVTLDDTKPSEISQWVSFSSQKFTVKAGEWFTQKVKVSLPKNTGFSYSLVLIISRTNDPTNVESARVLKGSLAVFTLINVDRPGAVRKLEVTEFDTTSDVYEYLPATVNMRFKNIGNTILQPYGNVFIQRGTGDTQPLATLPVNNKGGYILPGSNRLLTSDWADGFPLYQKQVEASGSTKTVETWDWSRIGNFKLGNFTAKLIAVYNDGLRDVSIEKTTSFWVLPWKIILGFLVIILLVGFGLWSFFKKIWTLIRRGKKKPEKKTETTE